MIYKKCIVVSAKSRATQNYRLVNDRRVVVEKHPNFGCFSILKQMMGIEPTLPDWKSGVLAFERHLH